jgi:metal-responsive CopG/Arc/MetJ family transcriptional regulator
MGPAMPRTSRVINVSVPPAMAREYARLARRQKQSKSALFRDMMEAYKRERWMSRFRDLQRYGARKAREAGIHTEADVDRLVFEDR